MLNCDWCGLVLDSERRRGMGAFCSPKCKLAWHNQREREDRWHLLTMVRQLWPYRPEGWIFAPVGFPGTHEWRREWNAASVWVRSLIDQQQGRDNSDD